MRKWRIAYFMGGTMIFIGLALAGQVIFSNNEVQTFSATIEPDHYIYTSTTDEVYGGSISGVFETNSGVVDFYIFSEEQFSAYVIEDSYSCIYHASGSMGRFSVGLPSGLIYVVVEHGNDYFNSHQIFTLDYSISEFEPIYLDMGVMLLLIGAAVSIYGFREKRLEIIFDYVEPYLDVTIFEYNIDRKPTAICSSSMGSEKSSKTSVTRTLAKKPMVHKSENTPPASDTGEMHMAKKEK